MEKDIGLSREELIEMLKKAEEEKAELTAENSSLRNAVVDSKARIMPVRAEPRSAEGGEEEGGEKDIRARAFQQELRAYGDEEHFLRTVLERYLVANKVLTRELIRQLYANSRSEKTSELAKKGICVSPAADRPSDSPDTLKAETVRGKRARGTADFECIPGRRRRSTLVPKERPCAKAAGSRWTKGEPRSSTSSPTSPTTSKTRYIVHCYVCPHCGKTYDTSEKAEDAYGLSGCTPSLGAFFPICYGAYLPRNRSARRPRPVGIPSLKTLIVRYCSMTAKVFAPIAARMKEDLRKAHVVHIDETPLQLPRSREPHQLLLGGHNRASEPSKIMLYRYENDRRYEHAKEILGEGFGGTVVSDQYGAYAGFGHLAYCYSHLERPLISFLAAYPEDSRKDRDFLEVQELVTLLKEAFGAERRLKSLSPEERRKRRQTEVKPLVDRYFELAAEYRGKTGRPRTAPSPTASTR